MPRLFVAIRPPAAVREQLLDLMEGLPGARWQDDEQLHITLRFIGDVGSRVADDVLTALEQVRHAPITMTPIGVGQFATRGRVNSIWVGVQPQDGLAHLHRKVDQAIVRAGLPPERRAYLPHITLARFGRTGADAGAWIAGHAGFSGVTFTAGHFAIYESHLGQTGATYEIVERYPLAPF